MGIRFLYSMRESGDFLLHSGIFGGRLLVIFHGNLIFIFYERKWGFFVTFWDFRGRLLVIFHGNLIFIFYERKWGFFVTFWDFRRETSCNFSWESDFYIL